jgi:ABC-type sugar transport system permease subunit
MRHSIFTKQNTSQLISFFSSKKTNNSLQPKDIKWLFSIPAILFFILFFTIQVLLPFRYALYPKNLFETEQGYRFSWRVMLMEKAGTCFFYVQDKNTHKRVEVDNHAFLTTQQEKQMSTQPDMILQFAHHLKKVYKKRWQSDTIEVHVESYVSINGKGSSLYIDPTINLGEIEDGFSHKNWILATR